jgi:hypothetical protein
MIFQTAALATLLYSASALSTEGLTAKPLAGAMKKELKAKLLERTAVSPSLVAKVEKITKQKSKAQTVDLETTTFDEPQTNLRGLKMRDNFLTMGIYSDDQCTSFGEEYGFLVNYCTNQQGTDSGVKKSYIVKVNMKENLVVEIEYDGFGCKVCNDHRTDLLLFISFLFVTVLLTHSLTLGSPFQSLKCLQ